jgi:glycosyltransferase involved in cell wall biosynthesis
MSIACSIGVMAYNEEANIGGTLEALVSQRTAKVTLSEIVVVASGCTDRTASIVQDWAKRDARIRLIVQSKRPAGYRADTRHPAPEACSQVVISARDNIDLGTAASRLH